MSYTDSGHRDSAGRKNRHTQRNRSSHGPHILAASEGRQERVLNADKEEEGTMRKWSSQGPPTTHSLLLGKNPFPTSVGGLGRRQAGPPTLEAAIPWWL